jgi:hypothetical protein
MKDAKESYGIMPFATSADEREWWVIRNRGMKVMHILRTKEEAFDKALYHNKGLGIPAVWVMGLCAKNGRWVEASHSSYAVQVKGS